MSGRWKPSTRPPVAPACFKSRRPGRLGAALTVVSPLRVGNSCLGSCDVLDVEALLPSQPCLRFAARLRCRHFFRGNMNRARTRL